MPYKNIHFIKVKMELLEDHRFLFQLNDRQKGLYLMLLALAGKTNNKIYNDLTFIKGRLAIKEIDESDLKTISSIFPKFYLDNDFWKFENFNEEHNQILGISKGYPKDTQRMAQNKNRIEKNRKEVISETDFINSLKNNSSYKHIDIDQELGKMDAWLLTRPGRKKTKKFVLMWLNKIEVPMTIGKNGKPEPKPFPKDA